MIKTHFAVALLASTLLAAPAFAQSQTGQTGASSASEAATMQKPEQWRTSKLIGLDVYNNNNEKIGDIDELMMQQSGQIELVVIGVGGFLGIGEHRVALPFNQVKFSNEPRGSTATTGAGTTSGSGTREYPDHATLDMTRDQLRQLPAFRYASEARSDGATGSQPAQRPAQQPQQQQR
ncbi:MAG TPA: PRC-barrel domain-containing protein [Xanthobacteraceae bacterium]|jgi:sporulation protein YlmC with PRC-barrel domain